MADVAVKIAVQPLLQKSAIEISERFNEVFEKIGTGIENFELAKIPVASDVMWQPLGSPNVIPPSDRIFFRNEESESQKIVLVAPVS